MADDTNGMKNMSIAGFLIKKTVQPASLRSEQKYLADFKSKNIFLFLNKKFAEIRNRTGMKALPKELLSSACLHFSKEKRVISLKSW